MHFYLPLSLFTQNLAYYTYSQNLNNTSLGGLCIYHYIPYIIILIFKIAVWDFLYGFPTINLQVPFVVGCVQQYPFPDLWDHFPATSCFDQWNMSSSDMSLTVQTLRDSEYFVMCSLFLPFPLLLLNQTMKPVQLLFQPGKGYSFHVYSRRSTVIRTRAN